MKPNKEIIEKLLRNLEYCHAEFNDIFSEYSQKLKTAESIERVMVAKQSFLLSITKNIPLGTANCYFCLQYSPRIGFEGCKNCQWGKVHGTCYTQNSDYLKIQNLRVEFQKAIEELYYKGEIYKNDK